MPRLLITGTRNGWDHGDLIDKLTWAWEELGRGEDTVLIHGGASGVDAQAGYIWQSFGYPVEVHKADWDQYHLGAGPIRNQEMVDLGADLCLAFPSPSSKGTYDCINKAKAAGIRVVVFEA